jgi:hypothetical protein
MMQKFILSLFASMLVTTAIWAQNGPSAGNPADKKVKFARETIDLGKIQRNKPVTVDFEFTNISKEPVLVESARANCRCATANWTKEPILPGKKGKVTATYSANTVGQQNKTIWVKLKGVDQDKELHLTGTVQN